MEGYALFKERGRNYFINEELRLENRADLGKKNDENRATSLISPTSSIYRITAKNRRGRNYFWISG